MILKMKRHSFFIAGLAIMMALALAACGPPAVPETPDEEPIEPAAQPEPLPVPAEDDMADEEDAAGQPLFSSILPEEFMAFFRGHELPAGDNPVTGAYSTTSGCLMTLTTSGVYTWQDYPDDPDSIMITGTYELFEGTIQGLDDGSADYVFESETGPLYTVIITFDGGQGAAAGALQVFDYYKEDVYRVTDLINEIWFEATRVS